MLVTVVCALIFLKLTLSITSFVHFWVNYRWKCYRWKGFDKMFSF